MFYPEGIAAVKLENKCFLNARKQYFKSIRRSENYTTLLLWFLLCRAFFFFFEWG